MEDEYEKEGSYFASLALSLSSLPHSQSLPGSTAKCSASSLCSESVSGMTAGREGQKDEIKDFDVTFKTRLQPVSKQIEAKSGPSF